MSTQDARILPLGPDVVAKLKSSTSIIHLNGVIVELVKNALDANAHGIAVTVDFQRGGCVVEDDGEGIAPGEFGEDGGLGKPHHTSKFNSSKKVYGRRGLFLASLASLSLLTITSRHVRHQNTNTVIFHHSTPIARLIPAPTQQRLRFGGYGTRVTVNDLFGNMPVRVKSRALALQKPDELERSWEELKQLLAAVILANDHLTKLILSDGRRRITIRPQVQGQRSDDELDVYRVSSIIVQASLANFQGSDWNVVSASVPDFSIHAAICLQPNPTKKVQFISLGNVPVFPRNSTNVLYGEINRLFAMSDFGSLGSGGGSVDKDHANIKMAPKSVNKWPMFYIRIDTNIFREWDDDEVAPESDKSIQHILDVLTAMINEFLTQHDLRPRAGKRKRKGPSHIGQVPDQNGQERRSREPRDNTSQFESTEETLGEVKLPNFRKPASQNFGDWSRVKNAKELLPTDLPIRKPADLSGDNADDSTSEIPWTDPYTGQTHMVNSRTGQSTGLIYNKPLSSGLQATRPSSCSRPKSTLPADSWVGNVLKEWENPAFSRPEQPINSLDGVHALESVHKCADLCGLDTVKISRFRGKLWKQHLDEAEVIAQVDRKFILAKLAAPPSLPGDDTGVLVLIDQHAADERCRVERLFEDLFTGDKGQVQAIAVDPIGFHVPKAEKYLLQRYSRFFQSWGIGYKVEKEQNQVSNDVYVSVHSLPALVAERCRTEPTLASDLIRREIWAREEQGSGSGSGSGNPPDQTQSQNDTVTWAERLSSCPQGLIDMINSRACRTAIMFNDELDVSECQTLVAQLARCIFPFQCAHGRPSLVPILETQANSSSPPSFNADSPGPGLGFLEAFKASGLSSTE